MKDGITETPQEAFNFILARIADGKRFQMSEFSCADDWIDSSNLYTSDISLWSISYLIKRHFRLPPAPKTVELEQSDWADGPWWVKLINGTSWFTVDCVNSDGSIEFCDDGLVSSSLLKESYLRSRTCRPDDWNKCEKEVK